MLTIAMRTLLAILILSVAACSDTLQRNATEVRDSAGIQIIEHGNLSSASVPAWGLAEEPSLLIGTVSGQPEYQFHRIQDVVRLSSGSIAVLDGSRTVRVYDPNGAFVWSAGGEGEGPGEFRYPYAILELPDDSISVWDSRLNRLTVFTGGGQYMRSATVSGFDLPGAVWGLTAEGDLLVEIRRFEPTTIEGHRAMLHPSDFYLVNARGEVARSLGQRMYAVAYQEVDENGAFSGAIFATEAVVAPGRNGLWYGNADAFELREEVGPGEVSRIVRWEGPDRTITDADVEAVLEHWSEGVDPETRSRLAAYGRTHPRSDHFPAYEQLIVDQVGRLWIKDYVKDHEDDGLRYWVVLSSDGAEVLGRATTPATLEIHDIGEDWVAGVTEDELGVESVAIFAIEMKAGHTIVTN